MKIIFSLFIALEFFADQSVAQTTMSKPQTETTLAPVSNTQSLRHVPEPKKTPPPAPPANIQRASVDILNGDDGKDNDTYVAINLLDNNQRAAASYSNAPYSPNPAVQGRPNDEYFSGSSISLPMKTETSIPTGQITTAGSLILPVLRYATPGDFSNGGEIKITINPNGHDTWKIQTLSVTISFENDSRSPHRITWSNIVLSQDSRSRDLLFDKNFNPL